VNEIEVGRLLTAAKVLDPKMPQPDAQGFVLRLWTKALHDVPMAAAEEALQEYYRSAKYREHRDPISPADIVQWHRDRRRYAADQRQLEPVVPALIHQGVDKVFAELARRKAVEAGEDAEMAVEIADGETAIRREYQSRKCKHCGAAPGCRCVDHRGRPLTKYPAHDCRINATAKNIACRGDAVTAEQELAEKFQELHTPEAS